MEKRKNSRNKKDSEIISDLGEATDLRNVGLLVHRTFEEFGRFLAEIVLYFVWEKPSKNEILATWQLEHVNPDEHDTSNFLTYTKLFQQYWRWRSRAQQQ